MFKSIAKHIWPLSNAALGLSIMYWWVNGYQRFLLSDSTQFVYWVMLFVNSTSLILAAMVFIGLVSSLSSWVSSKVQKISSQVPMGRAILVLFLASFLSINAAFPSLISSWVHVDTQKAGGKTYHLTAIQNLIDINFALMECDTAGILCKRIFLTGDKHVNTLVDKARLIYEEESNELSIFLHEDGIIYTIHP